MKRSNLTNLVFERDSYTCVLCTRAASETHHVISRAQRGRDVPHNLVSVCRWHHLTLHGQKINGCAMTQQEARQAVLAYITDCYAPP